MAASCVNVVVEEIQYVEGMPSVGKLCVLCPSVGFLSVFLEILYQKGYFLFYNVSKRNKNQDLNSNHIF